MIPRRLTRNNRGLNKKALNDIRSTPPLPMRPARTRINAVDPNVLSMYAEMYAAPPLVTTPRNDVPATPYTSFYPNAPSEPGPGSLAYKLKMEDPRHVSSIESRIKRRKSRKTRRANPAQRQ
jgi:hypothetical protein